MHRDNPTHMRAKPSKELGGKAKDSKKVSHDNETIGSHVGDSNKRRGGKGSATGKKSIYGEPCGPYTAM